MLQQGKGYPVNGSGVIRIVSYHKSQLIIYVSKIHGRTNERLSTLIAFHPQVVRALTVT
jgi:hypothetical protein